MEPLRNPKRLHIMALRGAPTNIYHPDPNTNIANVYHGRTAGTIFADDDDVILHGVWVNADTVAANALLSVFQRVGAVPMIGLRSFDPDGDTRFEGPVYVRGGFYISTLNSIAAAVMWSYA